MNKILAFVILALLIISITGMVSARVNSGAIWTTKESCDTPQDANQYFVGEKVYIHGSNFAPATYNWNIFAVPEKDPAIASGSYNVTSNEEFCFYAYTIQPEDNGVYKTYLGDVKSDNYHIATTPIVPEFGLFVGALTVMGAVGVFFFVRRQ